MKNFVTKVYLFTLVLYEIISIANPCYEDKSCGPDSNDWSGACHLGERQSPINLPYEPHRHTRRVALEFNDLYCSDGNFYIHLEFS